MHLMIERPNTWSTI